MNPDIHAVLVLYRMEPEESSAFQSLQAAARILPGLRDRLQLMIFDNSPQSHTVPASALKITYHSDPSNPGLAVAYNAALAEAVKLGSTWLLLLDQDTAFDDNYLQALFSGADSMRSTNIVAMVPHLIEGGRTHSPFTLPRLTHRTLARSLNGIASEELVAYNSGAALRVSDLQRTGGFPERYWLDYLDFAVFRQLQRGNRRMYVIPAEAEHRLSAMALDGQSRPRFLNMLRAEFSFYREYGSPLERTWYCIRRLRQSLGLLVRGRSFAFALLSVQAALGLLNPTQKCS